jgi:hypothetical protein
MIRVFLSRIFQEFSAQTAANRRFQQVKREEKKNGRKARLV